MDESIVNDYKWCIIYIYIYIYIYTYRPFMSKNNNNNNNKLNFISMINHLVH